MVVFSLPVLSPPTREGNKIFNARLRLQRGFLGGWFGGGELL